MFVIWNARVMERADTIGDADVLTPSEWYEAEGFRVSF